ncbi:MAG: hypothetical protein H0V51_12000 [Chloroflexi bacterium]|nr:hypothetical protein [Chloroflexota bacterium]
MEGAFSYNSELPGGRAPFWIKDHALAGIGLRPGDAVSVDSGEEPKGGELVLVELETDDGGSDRTVRRYFERGEDVLLKAENDAFPDIVLASSRVLLVGVVKTRVRFEAASDDRTRVVEEPLD